MSVGRGEVWWAELDVPAGSEPGYRRPVVVVQGEALNRSRLATVVCVPMTSNLAWTEAPGNVLVTVAQSGLPKDSVANASQIVALDRRCFTERAGKLSKKKLDLLMAGIDIVLGR